MKHLQLNAKIVSDCFEYTRVKDNLIKYKYVRNKNYQKSLMRALKKQLLNT